MSEENKEQMDPQETPESTDTVQTDAPPETQPEAQTASEAAPAAETGKKKKHDKENDRLKAEFDKIKNDLDSTKNLLLRTAAEYDNYRKRTDREKQGSVAFGTAGAVEKLLPVLDTLELAAAADTTDEAYKKGVTMTLDLFYKAIGDLGVEEIEGVGAPFDPNHHCAVSREASDEFDSGCIAKVLRKGYRLGDRVIRASMVSVAE